MASASPCSGLKSPIPNEYNIGQVLMFPFRRWEQEKNVII